MKKTKTTPKASSKKNMPKTRIYEELAKIDGTSKERVEFACNIVSGVVGVMQDFARPFISNLSRRKSETKKDFQIRKENPSLKKVLSKEAAHLGTFIMENDSFYKKLLKMTKDTNNGAPTKDNPNPSIYTAIFRRLILPSIIDAFQLDDFIDIYLEKEMTLWKEKNPSKPNSCSCGKHSCHNKKKPSTASKKKA